MSEAKKLLTGKIKWCGNAYEAMEKADVLVLLTEWNEFLRLNLEKVKGLLKAPVIVDLRNIYKRDEMQKAGIRYFSVGRGSV
jgi:UDPglucose 6-dehydrogenase